MPEKPIKRYARTPENILVALGCEPNRLMKSKLKLWMSWPDFPKAGKNGRDIEALKKWVDDNQDVFLADGKRAKLLQEGDKFSGGDLKLYQKSGARSQNPEIDADEEPLAKNQTAIANWLAHHFQMPVSKMDVSDWLRGERLDAGAVNFPVPDAAGRFNKLKCSDWFKKYKYREPSNQTSPDLFRQVEIEGKKSELERLEHERYLRGVERGQYIEKTEHNRVLASLGRIGRDQLWELFDRRAYEQMSAKLAAANIPEEIQQAVMEELRRLNPELLLKFHTHLEAVIAENEKEVPAPAKPTN